MKPEDLFTEQEYLQKHIDNYEFRTQQAEMAAAVSESLQRGETAIIEAGTGVGKSLAYLIPAVLWAVEENARVLVSTYSKALQQQLMEKELPFLKDTLGLDFHYAMAQGGQNYLCLRRFHKLLQQDLYESAEDAALMEKALQWRQTTSTGLRSEPDFEISSSLWSGMCRESDLCLRGKCDFITQCLYNRQKQKLRSAHILVVNHHLFFANLAAGESILPEYQAIVFDEAHCLEEVALDHLGIQLSAAQIKYLADSVYSVNEKGLAAHIGDADAELVAALREAAQELRHKNELFFNAVKLQFAAFPARIKQPGWTVNTLGGELKTLARILRKISSQTRDEELETELDALGKRAKEFAYTLDNIIEMDLEEYVYWAEQQRQKIALKASSVHIGEKLAQLLFNGEKPIILTSATLTTENSFGYIRQRLGIAEANELILDSPFEYKKNALLYMAGDLPDPKGGNALFEMESIGRIADLVAITGGRTLILFTSFRYLERAYEELSLILPELNWMKQGDMPHYRLIEQFKKQKRSVLLGTNSFWQGVDIPGEALTSVIITKLPFAVPDDPLTEARMEHLRSSGQEPFYSLQIPQAIIWLKQGFGRLIRSRRDRGLVAILDPRVLTKAYGRKFVKSLPPSLYTTRTADIGRFFENTDPEQTKGAEPPRKTTAVSPDKTE